MNFLLTGVIFGLSAGFAPGPLLTLVISETLQHNTKEGIKVAVAPLITDLPIVLFTILIISRLSTVDIVLGVISILGAAFLFFLGFESLFFRGFDIKEDLKKPQSLKKGIIANFLNPHPYIFWLSIGAPTVIKAHQVNAMFPVLYLGGFYCSIVAAKIILAVFVAKSKHLLKSKLYIYTNRFLGILLLLFAVLFLKEGLEYLNVI
ncbi:LysE family transporter [candidate division KSB1 bacterium]|nr:LysE family transporter [candidate division KSB1 bacterium]MBL7095996.1 LysE family transporter [candidate division KSB1 bacterium]